MSVDALPARPAAEALPSVSLAPGAPLTTRPSRPCARTFPSCPAPSGTRRWRTWTRGPRPSGPARCSTWSGRSSRRPNAAVHRGAHTLASEATDAFEAAREAVAGFVGRTADELVWTKNATEAINLVAIGLSDPASGSPVLGAGDEVLVTEAEHHANLVPWQQACARSGARLRWVPLGRTAAST